MKLIGIDEQINKVIDFVKNYKKYKKSGKCAILLHGPPGLGKTSTAHYVAEKLNYKLLEYNMGEYRRKENAIEIYWSCKVSGFEKRLILLDEFDTLAITPNKGEYRYPRVVIKYINKAFNESRVPIIITANDIKLIPKNIIDRCITVEYKRNQKSILEYAKSKGVLTSSWIPSMRHVNMIKEGSMSYSVNTLTGTIKYYLLSGIFKEKEKYDNILSIGLMENSFRSMDKKDIVDFTELLSICDIIKNYYPLDRIKFKVDKNKIDGKIKYFDILRENNKNQKI